MSNSLTLSNIAKRLKVDRHKVEYIVRSRNISADDQIGITKVYSTASFSRIESELSRIAEQERASHG